MGKGSGGKTTTANVCIVESLNFLEEEAHREGEIIYRTLRLSEKRPHYSYVRSREELESFIQEFGKSEYRYLHLSCHGNTGQFFTTLEGIPTEEMVHLLGKHLKFRRLFVSACLAADDQFAKALIEQGECRSVLGPVGSPRFDDAAIFWTAFYHLMFKASRVTMSSADIEATVEKCATLVGEDFRFFYSTRDGGEITEKVIRGS